jgi:hypothetical protein
VDSPFSSVGPLWASRSPGNAQGCLPERDGRCIRRARRPLAVPWEWVRPDWRHLRLRALVLLVGQARRLGALVNATFLVE